VLQIRHTVRYGASSIRTPVAGAEAPSRDVSPTRSLRERIHCLQNIRSHPNPISPELVVLLEDTCSNKLVDRRLSCGL
jgi:hypothetical protein